ncbi:hypothetical protein Mapa_000801 [Marchantia paleacea]|nr:hypothetical protein Mapa_000801 [Marchantia paleacea]
MGSSQFFLLFYCVLTFPFIGCFHFSHFVLVFLTHSFLSICSSLSQSVRLFCPLLVWGVLAFGLHTHPKVTQFRYVSLTSLAALKCLRLWVEENFKSMPR